MKNPLIRIFILLLVLTFAVLVSRGVFGATITANFPTSLDSWSDGDIIEDEDIEALQVKIGIDSSAVATSLDYLIKNTSSKLGKIASLAVTDSNIIVGDGTNWVAESGATARTSLGLGTGDSPSFTGLTLSGDLTVTGGDITLGTTSIFSGGDTASLNNIDAVDATTESTFESAIDSLTNLTAVGTLTTGTWNATDVAVGAGGTGLGTIAAGSVWAANSLDTISAITSTVGTTVLTNTTGTITWATGASGDVTSVGDCADGACFDGTQGTTLTFNNAGGDKTLDYDGTDFLFNAPISIDASDGAEAGAIRLDNAENIAWEAAPAGTDMTLGVDASEILQYSGVFNATSITEATVGVINSGEIDTYSEINAIVADVTLTHNGLIDTLAELETIMASINILAETEIDASSELLVLMDDETGTGALVFGTSPTFTTDITFPLLSIEAGAYGAATIDGDDINSNLAGRSLTLTAAAPDTLDADAELYTDTKCIWFESPVAADDFKSVWFAKQAATLSSIWAESDQTVTFMLQVDDGTPADVDTVDLAPAAGTAEDTALNGDATMAAGDRLDIDLVSVANTPTWVSICFTFAYDD